MARRRMRRMVLRDGRIAWAACFAVLVGGSTRQAAAESAEPELADPLIRPVAEAWDVGEELLPGSAAADGGQGASFPEAAVDEGWEAIVPVQMSAPAAGSVPGLAAAGTRPGGAAAAAGRRSRVARTPYMIGDTVAGTCTTFAGLLLEAELSHPTLACARLNISENNSAIPADRLYFSYRHYHNATRLRAFQFEEIHNLDRFTLGGEHTFYDGLCSVEVRLPIDGRVGSELQTIDTFNLDGTLIPFSGTRRTELANVSAIFKVLLTNQPGWALSGGLGVTMPTAEDFHYTALIYDTIVFNDFPFPGDVTTTDRNTFIDVQAANETWYLAPFLAWLWAPQPESRWFHQGFFQVEAAANPSAVKIAGDGFNVANIPGFPPTNLLTVVPASTSRADINPQTLMRLNLGMGCHFLDNPRATWIQRMTGLLEMHYTTTLEDAKFDQVTAYNFLTDFGNGFEYFVPEPIVVGNAANRSDLLNAAAGVSAQLGSWLVTNSVIAPLRDEANRGFDFEYNLQVQRNF